MNVEVNYLAVFVASVVSMGVGFVWYTVLFGKSWMKLMGYTKASMEEARKGMGKTYAISFAFTLLMAYMLFHVMVFSDNYYHYTKLMTGFASAFSMWLGFVAPVQATDVLFGGKTWKLFWINTGYQLASLLAMGLTMAMMG